MAEYKRQPRWELALYRFIRALVLGVAKLFGRIKIIGGANIPRDRPFVLATGLSLLMPGSMSL